jgi:uncharacterized repeat protein (TIGR03803 family)
MSDKDRRRNIMKILRNSLVIVLVVLAGRTFHANAQTETAIYSFGSSVYDGSEPYAGLVQGSDSNFYGTTLFGGTNGYGTVFWISPSGTHTTLYSFVGSPNDGSYPQAGLVQGSDSNFYGTTIEGGTSTNCNGGCGTVFRISLSGSYTTLYSFAGSPNDGAYPYAALVQGSDSNFYGTTEYGGTNYDVAGLGYGTVFRISPSGTHTTLYSFAGSPNDGSEPYAGLAQGGDGNFYGTTYDGGTSTNCNGGCGTVFRISPSGTYTTLYSFAGSPDDGFYPEAGLVQGSDSNFYGTTSFGGTNAREGTVFEIDVGGGGTNCTFSITSNSANFSAAGGSCNVSVTASNGCAWTATSSDPSFITINSGSSGLGSGTVSYTVAANPGTARSGTMTIGGQTFTVDQTGAASVTYSWSSVVQTCKTKTKINKKTETTNTTTTCTIAFKLVVSNTGATKSPKFSVLLWLEQGCAFNPTVGPAPLAKKVKALKENKSATIKVKAKVIGDQAGTFIFVTDPDNNVLASVEVPSPE